MAYHSLTNPFSDGGTLAKQSKAKLSAVLIACAIATSCGLDGSQTAESTSFRRSQAALADRVPSDAPPEPTHTVVYRQVRVNERGGEVTSIHEQGDLSAEQWQRVARPYRHLAPDEDFVYDENAWGGQRADGRIEHGYEVTRRPNSSPVTNFHDSRPVRVSSELSDQLSVAADDELVEVLIGIRDFPEWNVPLRPPKAFRSASTNASLAEQRQAALGQRQAVFDDMASGIEQAVSDRGGTIVERLWRVGYLHALLPASRVLDLLHRSDVSALEPENVNIVSGATIGDEKYASRTDESRFYYSGHDGRESNSGRHSYGRVTAAVIEAELFEDEACAFQDGSGNCGNHSTDRILKAFKCDSGSCVQQASGFSNSDESTYGAAHGTNVASILAGDYQDGQGDGYQLGDPNWTSGAHSGAWEWDASGTAPEAYLMLLGGNSGCASCYADSFSTSVDEDVDVINGSWAYPSNSCDPTSSNSVEDAAEVAYDDGIFVAMCSGNNGINGGCNVSSPGDIPKTFTIGGLNTSSSSCLSDYNDCVAHSGSSSRGGGTITVDGHSRNVALMDMLAPGRLYRHTGAAGTYGTVGESYNGGCSFATPFVAGAAASQKDVMLDQGETWINNPGRLQAQMLAMTDSWHDDAGSRASYGLDDLSGTGRLKMRLFDSSSAYETDGPIWWRSYTATYTSTGTTSFMFKSTPMNTGTEFIKCVLWEGEDMSSKSDVYLSMTIRSPQNGECSSSGTYQYGISDSSYDIRHMVNLKSSSVTLAGNCAEVKLHRAHVTTSGTTVTAFCYSSGVSDDDY